jgi:hypothetical protein
MTIYIPFWFSLKNIGISRVNVYEKKSKLAIIVTNKRKLILTFITVTTNVKLVFAISKNRTPFFN